MNLRALTPAVRAELGLPLTMTAPYRWGFAALVVGLACVPLLLASLWTLCVAAAIIGLVVLPAVRWFERRDAGWRDDVYRRGVETRGRITDVEPASPGRSDHIVRVEFRTDQALVRASIVGCSLARRGLAPDDEVIIYYAPERPTQCLVIRRVPTEIIDAVFD